MFVTNGTDVACNIRTKEGGGKRLQKYFASQGGVAQPNYFDDRKQTGGGYHLYIKRNSFLSGRIS